MAHLQVSEGDGMPAEHQMQTIVSDWRNSGISINYVSGWALKEALRELIQNAVDGMMSFMKSVDANATKKDWFCALHETNHTNGVYRTFPFTWPARNMVLGKITYEPDSLRLTLENPGTINKV